MIENIKPEIMYKINMSSPAGTFSEILLSNNILI